jgi:hypothetical protein
MLKGMMGIHSRQMANDLNYSLSQTPTILRKWMSSIFFSYNDGDTFKANGQRLKLFIEPNLQNFEEVDVLNFLELE